MLRIALLLALASCAAGDIGPEASTLPCQEDTEPVGGFLGGDRVTEARIFELMRAHGIAVDAYGSLGYTVSAPVSHAEEARRLLADAIAHEGLQANVYTAADVQRALSHQNVD
jgi:hypothetical protein